MWPMSPTNALKRPVAASPVGQPIAGENKLRRPNATYPASVAPVGESEVGPPRIVRGILYGLVITVLVWSVAGAAIYAWLY